MHDTLTKGCTCFVSIAPLTWGDAYLTQTLRTLAAYGKFNTADDCMAYRYRKTHNTVMVLKPYREVPELRSLVSQKSKWPKSAISIKTVGMRRMLP